MRKVSYVKTISYVSAAIYQKDFLALVEEEKVIGFDSKSGLQGGLRSTVHKTEDMLKDNIAQIEKKIEEHIISETVMNIMLIAFLSLITVLLSTIIGRMIFTKIAILKSEMEYISSSKDLSQRNHSNDNDELSAINNAFYALLDEFETILDEITKMSNENSAATLELSTTAEAITERVNEEMAIVDDSKEKNIDIEEKLSLGNAVIDTSNEQILEATASLSRAKEHVEGLIGQVSQNSEKNMELAQRLSEVNGDAEQVKGVLTVISEIADQTNLLELIDCLH